MLSVFITPCTNPTRIQWAMSRGLRAFHRRFQQSEGRVIGPRPVWKVASGACGRPKGGEGVGAHAGRRGSIRRCRRGCGWPRRGVGPERQEGASRKTGSPGGGHGEAAGGRNAEGVHRLADAISAASGRGRPAVAAPREGSVRPFELDVELARGGRCVRPAGWRVHRRGGQSGHTGGRRRLGRRGRAPRAGALPAKMAAPAGPSRVSSRASRPRSAAKAAG